MKILINLIVALFNATMILIVAALVLLIILVNKLETFPENIADHVSSAIIGDAVAPIELLTTEIKTIDQSVKALTVNLQEMMAKPNLVVSEELKLEIQSMNKQLNGFAKHISQSSQDAEQAIIEVNQSIDEFGKQLDKIEQIDVKKLGTIVTKSVVAAFQCKPPEAKSDSTAPR